MIIAKWIVTCLSFLFFVNSFAQNAPDRHSTDVNDGWVSCQSSPNPNSLRGVSHWIRYDLGAAYVLGTSKMWNYNHPDNLDRGLNQIAVDVSTNGVTWTQVGLFSLDKAIASGFYEGQTGLNFNGTTARYVLITAISNYGGQCYGFGELKINLANAPLPITLVDFEGDCQDRFLAWVTKDEINSDFFAIEASIDGTLWNTIGKIPCRNEGNLKNDYRFDLPIAVLLPAYFRLKQVDLDGKYYLTKVIHMDCKPVLKIDIFPNPTSDVVNIQSDLTTILSYELSDISGTIIQKGILSDINRTLSLADISSGIYTIRIFGGGNEYIQEIVKI